jgi:Ras-related protein Rab-11A
MTPAYYRNTVGALMVFDLTKMKSFENLEIWLKEARSYSNADIAIVLVGNKLDLVNNREVKAEMI